MAERPAAPPPAPPRAWVCVYAPRGGVASEWCPPPAGAAAASWGLPESRAGGQRACGFVWTVTVASSRLGGRRSGPLLSSGACCSTGVIAHSLPKRPGCARGEGRAHTRVSGRPRRPEPRSQGGRRGAPRAARHGPRTDREQPRLPAALAAAVLRANWGI